MGKATVSKGIYQTTFQTVHEAYQTIMMAANAIPTPLPPKPDGFYLIWATIVALCAWQACIKIFTVFIFLVLMLFIGPKGGPIVLIAILNRAGRVDHIIKHLISLTKPKADT